MVSLKKAHKKSARLVRNVKPEAIARWAERKSRTAVTPDGEHDGPSSPQNGANGKESKGELQAAITGIDATINKALKLAGCTIEEFRKLPKHAKHAGSDGALPSSESVRAHGVLENGIARPSPSQPGRFELIAGERRWNAAVIAKRATMPLKIREAHDDD